MILAATSVTSAIPMCVVEIMAACFESQDVLWAGGRKRSGVSVVLSSLSVKLMPALHFPIGVR